MLRTLQRRKNDESHPPPSELFLEGREEAKRLKRDVIPTLNKGLKPLAKKVIKIGLQVKQALGEVRALKSIYWEEYETHRQQAAIEFDKSMDELQDHLNRGKPYPKGEIQTAFQKYQGVARQHQDIESRVDQSEAAQALHKLLDKDYSSAVLALDKKAREMKAPRLPWELRYFAMSEMDKMNGKKCVQIGVSFGCDTSSTLDDQCRLCHKIIPSNEDRVRSFETSSRKATMRSACFQMVRRAESVIATKYAATSTTDNAMDFQMELGKQELLHIWPYRDHLLVTEKDSISGLRDQVLGFSDHNKPNNKKATTIRKLLPRFLHLAYRNRPLFGVPQDESLERETRVNRASDDCEGANHQLCHVKIPYEWFTYNEVWQVICTLSSELLFLLPPVKRPEDENTKGPPSSSLSVRPEIGIVSSPSPIFFALQMACISLGRISVGMDTSWNVNDVWKALEQTEVSTLLLDREGFRMLTLSDNGMQKLAPCIERVVVIASDPFRRNEDAKDIDQALQYYDGTATIEVVMANPSEWWNGPSSEQAMSTMEAFRRENETLPTDQYLFGLFSSGTSGSGGHKGILVREKTFREANKMSNFYHPIVSCLKNSPSWASGNDIVWQTLLAGGRVGFATARSEASSSIWRHIYSVKPTWRLSFVPALITDLMEEYSQALEFFQSCNANSSDDERMKQNQMHFARAKAAEYLYSCLGGKIDVISVGGAMVNQAHVDFLSKILPCEIYQGYGSTEGGGIAIATHNEDRLIPNHTMKFRVESKPALGYTMEDEPFPRGELLVLGKETATACDWFGEKETVQAQMNKYSDDGYYRTGDIVELHPDANAFRIIDRISSLVKLPDGVFFSPHRVEASIGDLTEHGISGFIVAATVQGTVVLILESAPTAHEGSTDDLNILSDVQHRCREANLSDRCIPRRLVIDEDSGEYSESSKGHLWKRTNCYTVSGKLIRHRVYDRVKHLLVDADKLKDVEPIARAIGTTHKEEETALALIDAIGIPRASNQEEDNMASLPLTSIGVDSLLWVKLRSVVRRSLAQRGLTGTKLPFFDSSEKCMIDVAHWMSEMVNQVSPESSDAPRETEETLETKEVPICESKSPVGETNHDTPDTSYPSAILQPISARTYLPQMSSMELAKRAEFQKHAHNIDRLEQELFRLVDAEVPEASASSLDVTPNPTSDLQRVFLTGATGFLGRHILRFLLIGGVDVTCLVRGNSSQEARSRVISGVSKSGLTDEAVFDRLSVLVGSIAFEKFGLCKDEYDSLAANTDAIVHAAAEVKIWSIDSVDGNAHEMVYTNTQSCVAIARLSAYAKRFGRRSIPIVYTSTKSVESELPEGIAVEEVGHHYSSSKLHQQPYTISKLLGETVLIRGSRNFQYSLCILRLPLLTFSSDGDSNDTDFFARLLLTVADLGLAPSGGRSEFLSKKAIFEPVDDYAKKVVDAVFAQLEEVDAGFGSHVKWADAYGDESKPALCLEDILKCLRGDIRSVPIYAFRSALLLSKRPQPFLPLVDYLVQHRGGFEYKDGADLAESTETPGKIPSLLYQGLSSFLTERCPGITINNNVQ